MNDQTKPTTPPPLTDAAVRRVIGWSQVRVAGLADVAVATVRLFELDAAAIADEAKRRALRKVYAQMREALLARTF